MKRYVFAGNMGKLGQDMFRQFQTEALLDIVEGIHGQGEGTVQRDGNGSLLVRSDRPPFIFVTGDIEMELATADAQKESWEYARLPAHGEDWVWIVSAHVPPDAK